MTRNERLKLKYALIKNKYQDTDLATEAKHWGWNTLAKELGISKPQNRRLKQGYKLKKFDKRTIYNKHSELKKVKKMQGKGFAPKDIRHFKRKSQDAIQDSLRTIRINDRVAEVYRPESRTERYDLWRWWSDRKANNMPEPIKLSSYEVNRIHTTARLHTKNSKFGFATLFFMYVDEKTYPDALKMIEPSQTNVNQYVYKENAIVGRRNF